MAAVTRPRRVPRAPLAGTITNYSGVDNGSRNESVTLPPINATNPMYGMQHTPLVTLEPGEQSDVRKLDEVKVEPVNDLTPGGPSKDDLL